MAQVSPELRDLLDQIFVADEFKRITIQVSWADQPGWAARVWLGNNGEPVV